MSITTPAMGQSAKRKSPRASGNATHMHGKHHIPFSGRARSGEVGHRLRAEDLDEGQIIEVVLSGDIRVQVQRAGTTFIVRCGEQAFTVELPSEALAREKELENERDRKRRPWAYSRHNNG
jgi:hypothetical protein